MKKTLLLLSLLAVTNAYSKPHTFTIFDLNPGSKESTPHGFTTLNGKMIFAASTAATGYELWASDGTMPGTIMIKEIFPGSSGSNPKGFMEMNGQLYFTATDKDANYELWKTDGTGTGTTIVKDINPTAGGLHKEPKVVLDNKLYFIGNDGTAGYELWVTDGTANGTQMVKDINPGPQGAYDITFTESFIVYNGKVYFTAKTINEGVELWVTDGTANGTQMVKDINPGAAGSDPGAFFPGASNASPSYLTVYKNKLYFIATTDTHGAELWESDGTANGTTEVIDLFTGTQSGAVSIIASTATNKLYLQAGDATTGYELYTSDGTANGTSLVKDIFPGSDPSSIAFSIEYNNNMYFTATDGVKGVELWKTDGTANGTQIVKDILAGSGTSDPKMFAVFNNYLYFMAYQTSNSYQLYRTDGSATGTTIILNPQATIAKPILYVGSLHVFNSNLFFNAAYDASGFELWMIDSDASTSVKHVNSDNPNSFTLAPNPNNGYFTITLQDVSRQQGAQMNMYDMTGRLVYTQKAVNNEQLIRVSLACIPKGLYMIELKTEGWSSMQKMVVD